MFDEIKLDKCFYYKPKFEVFNNDLTYWIKDTKKIIEKMYPDADYDNNYFLNICPDIFMMINQKAIYFDFIQGQFIAQFNSENNTLLNVEYDTKIRNIYGNHHYYTLVSRKTNDKRKLSNGILLKFDDINHLKSCKSFEIIFNGLFSDLEIQTLLHINAFFETPLTQKGFNYYELKLRIRPKTTYTKIIQSNGILSYSCDCDITFKPQECFLTTSFP